VWLDTCGSLKLGGRREKDSRLLFASNASGSGVRIYRRLAEPNSGLLGYHQVEPAKVLAPGYCRVVARVA
jgi:hypothetical protein